MVNTSEIIFPPFDIALHEEASNAIEAPSELYAQQWSGLLDTLTEGFDEWVEGPDVLTFEFAPPPPARLAPGALRDASAVFGPAGDKGSCTNA